MRRLKLPISWLASVLALAICVAGSLASADIITTIAGTGTGGYNGDGIAATTAQINDPYGVALDGAGNVYIAENNGARLRKVTLATGLISTVAGNGTGTYNGDGIPATSAGLLCPSGVAVDSSGNVYIADRCNDRIRKVTVSTGLISTIAGTGTGGYNGDGIAATSAKMTAPFAVTVDAAGNVYIADSFNQRIRKVAAAGGLISTIAGTVTATGGYNGDGIAATTAQLFVPSGVAVDSAGNVYIRDVGNSRVRKVTFSSGQISTIAGTGTAGFNGNGIPATSAQINNWHGVAVDTAGNVYVADGSRIRKVTLSTGLISTIAGNGTYGYNGDGIVATSAELWTGDGVAVDNSGTIYIADYTNHRIRKVVPQAELSATILAVSPAVSSTGQTVTVRMTVTNTGSIAASNLVPVMQVVSGASLVSLATGPTPANVASLAAGGSATFVWTYTTSTLFGGTASFSVTVTGTDAVTVCIRSASTSGILTINTTAALEAALAVSPAMSSTGQTVTVRMTVTNTGSIAASNLVPVMQVVSGASLVSLATGPTPANVASLAGGGSVTFVWTYTTSSTQGGAASFSATVTGTDAGGGGTRSASASAGLAITPSGSAGSRSIVDRVIPGHVLVGPNVIDRSTPSVRAVIAAKGRAGESVTFAIYDELGREVRRLSQTTDAGGVAEVVFDGMDGLGKALGDGVYYVVGQGGGVDDKRKLVIVTRRKR